MACKKRMWGGKREGAGRKREFKDGIIVTVRLGKKSATKLDRFLKKEGLKTRSAAIRQIVVSKMKQDRSGQKKA